MRDTDDNRAFSVQADVRAPWRRFLDALAPIRPALHRYCCKLISTFARGRPRISGTKLARKRSRPLDPTLTLVNPVVSLTPVLPSETRHTSRDHPFLATIPR